MASEEITPARLIYDFYMDEAARLGQRTDWFLIFHAVLLEAFFAAPEGTARIIVGLLGFLTSYLWFTTGYRQRWLSRHLGACMGNGKLMGAQFGQMFERIFEMRRKGLPRWIQWAMPVPTFAVVIPCAFAIAWFSLLLWAGRTRESIWISSVGVGLAVIATIWIRRMKNGPEIPLGLTDGLLQGQDEDPTNPPL